MCKKTILLLALAVCLVLTSEGIAGNFNPTEDSHVDESQPDENMGTLTRLHTQGPGSGNQKITYMKFVVSGLPGSVTSASVKLYGNTCTGDPVTAYAVSENSWTELGVTWENRPALGTALDTQNTPDNTWTTWDVSAFVTAEGTYTIALQGGVDVSQEMSARENSPRAPILRVNTEVSSSAFSIATSPYDTKDVIVYRESAAENSVVNDGSVDVTADIQQMINDVSAAGGGTVFLEEGTYRLDSGLHLPDCVHLRGVWEEPTPGLPIKGTVLAIYDRRGSSSSIPTIDMESGTAVKELVFWYPEQDPTNIVQYPPTVGAWQALGEEYSNASFICRSTFVNSYIAISNLQEDQIDGVSRHFTITNVHGTALYKAIDFGHCMSNPKFTGMFFEPDYWKYSGFSDSPTGTQHEAYMAANGRGIDMHTNGQAYIHFGKFVGYKYGLYQTEGDVSIYGVDFLNCGESGFEMLDGKIRTVDCTMEGSDYGLNVGTNGLDQVYHSCEFSGGTAAVNMGGGRFVGLHSCVLNDKAVVTSSTLSIVNSDFAFSGRHVDIESDAIGAMLIGNTYGGSFDYSDTSAAACVKIDHAQRTYAQRPVFTWADFRNTVQDFKPGNVDLLFDVTVYGAVGDAIADDTQAFQDALDAASAAGGGVVFVPPDWYNIAGTLTIPTDVELRGTYEGPHTPGTDNTSPVLFVTSGQGNATGTPFITMEANSGIAGLCFYYPEQIEPPYDYPFLIRANANIYVRHILATNPFQLIDLATNDCDNAVLEGIRANMLNMGYKLGNGTSNVRIYNGMGKGYWTEIPATMSTMYYKPDNPNFYTLTNLIQIDAGDVTDLYIVGLYTRENNYFVYAHDEGGQAPDNIIGINTGGEGTVRSYRVDALESDLHIINSQFKVNRSPEADLLKYQFNLNYTGTAKVVSYATVCDSKAEAEGFIHDGALELQGVRFQQQDTKSGFVVDPGASLVVSATYSQRVMPIVGDGSITVLGSLFDSGMSMADESLMTGVYARNVVAGYGRAVYTGAFETPINSGMQIHDTADSDNIVTAQRVDWGRTKELWYAGREPVLVDSGVKKLYFDVTSADFLYQEAADLDCEFEMFFFIEPNSTGDVEIYYDKNSGESLAGSFNVENVTQDDWDSYSTNMNNCEFDNRLNGGDIRIDIPTTADVTILWVMVKEKAIYCDAPPSGSNNPPTFNTNPINEIDATEDAAYSSTLADDASDPESDPLFFSKVSSLPAWLSVAGDGSLSGTPGSGDVGLNSWTVQVDDDSAAYDQATLNITVNPAGGGGGSWTELTFDDFEAGWGNYTDGGSDCVFYTEGTYAPQGTSAVNIRDNTGANFYLTNAIDVDTPGYTELQVDFSFIAIGMESGEDFWLQYNDGGGWQTVQTWALGTDFSNGPTYNESVSIPESSYTFSTTMQIRFVCDASSNNDDVYIDEIRIQAYDPGGGGGNNPPAFTSDPIVEINATEDQGYSSSIADDADDPDSDPMTFSKISGPAWLSVASNGALSGTPGAGDVGLNSFTVEVDDGQGGTDQATLEITVDATGGSPPGQASSPNPTDGKTKVKENANLSWSAGSGATSHDVYIGTTSGSLTFQGNQTGTSFNPPGNMPGGTWHYWRIDEVNAQGTTTGIEWTFKTK